MKSPMLFLMVPSVIPYDLSSPRLGFSTPTKTLITIISGKGEVRTSNLAGAFTGHSYIRRIARLSLR